MNRYGSKIREIREKNKDTLEDLAKKLDTHYTTVGKWERGERKITPELLEQIANIYEVSVSFFFGKQITLPDELKAVGGKWAATINKLEEQEITPQELEALLNLYKKMNKQ
ncbi:helix-turn-helix transcriptional regulator [Neobacillus sp. MM2021_6]|uniref:helix-turn-helix domain-containing protein n=1 Tax=Bacillaceae TaxID=186817 RepID=UPI00140A0A00|nr:MULTISPECIES: helix-turn-helix transcriptional regulator [Bacillaceae]MBO0959523.1 helix-turn-helix transcriptional regulator [Neobacillus sp. MM2021_6]NHC17179.1 helix-turn-helix transcriptional regulator [Bacillus sp. MM2020_4]